MNANPYDIIPVQEFSEEPDVFLEQTPPVVQLHEEFGYEPYGQGEYDYLNELAQLEQLVC